MMYAGRIEAALNRDELIGGEERTNLRNIKVGVEAKIKRGQLLCANSFADEFAAVGAADTGKVLVIAAEDFEASSDSQVTSAYDEGRFNVERIKVAEGVEIAAYEAEMRKQNLHLTSIKDIY